jgi:threonine/homoserine/homoserine lactone efflux protein
MAAVLRVLPGFLIAALALAVLPGPATALLIREALRGQRRRVVGAIGGIELGLFAWAMFAAFGLAALVAASALAYTALRAAGAAVLVLLGIQTLWYSRKRAPQAGGEVGSARIALRLTGFRGGLLTNLANPKAAVFAFSFYPQFIPPGANVLVTTLLLALVHVLVDVTWFSVLASAVTAVRGFFDRPEVKRRTERAVGAILVGLGVRLAID